MHACCVSILKQFLKEYINPKYQICYNTKSKGKGKGCCYSPSKTVTLKNTVNISIKMDRMVEISANNTWFDANKM